MASVSFSSMGCAKLREMLSGSSHDTASGTTSGGTKLPDGWPSNVPAYPGAKITGALATPQGKTAVMTTKDTPTQVHDFYKDKLTRPTMTLEGDGAMNGSCRFAAGRPS